jgi:tetratricopeptide (TPR) repeat protein
MAKQVMKYNPAFLSPAELVDQFVVRHGDFGSVLQTVGENTADANQHILVIGPRGSGKTMLVRRVAAEIDRDPELRERWYPLIFSEESYEVTTPGEFWLEAAFHIGQQTKDPRWKAKYEEYGAQWRDEDAMRERALGELMDFADQQGKRLLLIVENLNGLLGDQISDDDAWKLRHTLQNESRLMLLATATSRFEEVDEANKAMYELFRVHHLRPLDRDQCRVLWQSLTGQLLEGDHARPLQILTGGNVRLLTILSSFGAKLSLRQLMEDLVRLVDEHTEYFKSHLDALPPTERKVYLALAERWDPSTARDVAASARLDVNRTSSLLRRLVDRGAVTILDEPGRTKWYQVAERMYNVYYLFRRRGAPADRVRAVVRFMISFYSPEQLVGVAHRITGELAQLEPTERCDHYQVYYDLLQQIPARSLRDKLVEIAQEALAGLDDIPGPLTYAIAVPNEAGEFLAHVLKLPMFRWSENIEEVISHLEGGRFVEAEAALRIALEVGEDIVLPWILLGDLLENLSRFDEAERVYRRAVEIEPGYACAWALLAVLLHRKLLRFEEAEQAYRKAIEITPSARGIWQLSWGKSIAAIIAAAEEYRHDHVNADEEAPKHLSRLDQEFREVRLKTENLDRVFRQVIEEKPAYALVCVQLGNLLCEQLHRHGDAEAAYQKAVDIEPNNPIPRNAMLRFLCRQPERRDDAMRWAERWIARSPDDAEALNRCAWEFYQAGDRSLLERALAWAEHAVAIDPGNARIHHTLASVQCAVANSEQALEAAERYIADEEAVKDTVDDAVHLFVELAARGEAAKSLEILLNSPSRQHLEPLIVGLRIFLRQDVKVAAEIKEIGVDVSRRIEQRRDALASG